MTFLLIADNTEHQNDIHQFDFQRIAHVADHIDSYIEKARQAINNELKQNPATFGIKQEQMADYSKLADNEMPISELQVTFYPDNSMYLRFQEADFPAVDSGIDVYWIEDSIDSVDIFEADESTIIEENLP